MKPQRDWWVTVRLDPTRTQDYRVPARNEYAAGWLWRQLQPGAEIICVRPTTPHHHNDKH